MDNLPCSIVDVARSLIAAVDSNSLCRPSNCVAGAMFSLTSGSMKLISSLSKSIVLCAEATAKFPDKISCSLCAKLCSKTLTSPFNSALRALNKLFSD